VTVDDINNLVDFPRRLITVSSTVLCSLLSNNSGSIVALVDVFVQILDRSGRGAALNIDKAAILCRQS